MKNLFILVIILSFFSCDNSDRELTTDSGYEYKVIHHEEGGRTIEPGDIVKLKVAITSDNGDILQPAAPGDTYTEMQVPKLDAEQYADGPIPEVLNKSSVGDSVTIYVPTDSLPTLPPNMAAYEYIAYEMYIHDAVTEAEYTAEKEKLRLEGEAKIGEVEALVNQTIDSYKNDELNLQQTESGLKYYFNERGDGIKINTGDVAEVHYYGTLLNKKMFDNSFGRGQTFKTPVGKGQVIAGWDEGLQLLHVGDKVTFFIPSALGYGAAGAGERIPGDSELVFYVEVIDVIEQ